MRASEWIQGGFAVGIALAAWIVPLPLERRQRISVLAVCALAAIGLAIVISQVAPTAGSILRDWLPVCLTLIPYWQTGQFFTGPDEKIQARLVASDKWLFGMLAPTGLAFGRATRLTLEWAYSFCYPIVPLGLGVLCVAGLRREADTYWYVVLVSTYICYAITPFFPALPPRSLPGSSLPPGSSIAPRESKSRVFNLWLAKHGSIQAISFPSAHVASSLSTSLVLLHFVPVAGVVFLAVTAWIALAAVVERYHYGIDVVLGAAVAVAVYFAWRAGWTPSTLLTAPAISFIAWL